MNENYSKENDYKISDEKEVVSGNVKNDLNDVKYVKSNEKKCCKNCLIF